MEVCWSSVWFLPSIIFTQFVFFKRDFCLFVWDLSPPTACYACTSLIRFFLLCDCIFLFESTNSCTVMDWAAHITLWVVYVNNNNEKPWSFIPDPSGIPLTSFQLEKALSVADFLPSHWQFSTYCASSSDFLTLSWLKN